jgi:glycosyltransferase involved in cell wall biosynthesis
MKIRVLHILWTGRTGGAERFVRDIFHFSDQNKFEHALCFLAKGGPLESHLPPEAKIYTLNMQNGQSLLSGLKFAGVLHDFKPDIVHSHVRNYFVNLLLFLHPRIRRIYSEHGGSFDPATSPEDINRYKKFYQRFIRHYHLVLTNAEYLRQEILAWTGLPAENVKIYHYGIDTRRYGDRSKRESLRHEWGITPQEMVVGIVGRLVEQKGIDDFLGVAHEIRKTDSQCRFIIVGDGPLRASLTQLAQQLEVPVTFLGDRQDLPLLLPAFDVFIFTSRWEPFGIIILETFASRIPVVGFKVPGMEAIVQKGGGGILVENRDSRRLAQEVIALLRNPEQYKHLSSQAYENVKINFDVHTKISLLEQDYHAILSSTIQ